MYKNQFDKEFASNKNYKCYMFWGNNDYLIDQYSKKVSLKLANGEDIFKIYFDEYNFKDISNHLSSSSLFSSTNIVLIKTNKKIPKKELDQLITICNTNPDSFLVISCIGDVDFRSMSKSFTAKNSSVEVRMYDPTDQEAITILSDQSQKKSLTIGYGELQYLYNMHQKDLSLCVNDIEKLSILNSTITVNTINSHCFGLGAVSLDEFFIKLFSGQNINRELYMLLEEGLNEIYLVNQTSTFLQQLLNINTYIKLYGQLDIIKIWGFNLPKDIANKRAAVAMRYKLIHFKELLDDILELELNLKMVSKIDSNSYLQASFRTLSHKIGKL